MGYNSKIYYEYVPDELQGSHPKELKLSYKGFPIERRPPYLLFEITPREGCDPPAMLSGKYTKYETLERQIDHYLEEVPAATPETCTASGLTALSSNGPGNRSQHDNRTGSNPIGEN